MGLTVVPRFLLAFAADRGKLLFLPYKNFKIYNLVKQKKGNNGTDKIKHNY